MSEEYSAPESTESESYESQDVSTDVTDTGYNTFETDGTDGVANYNEGPEAEQEQLDRQEEENAEYTDEDINSAMMDYLQENYEFPEKFKDVGALINSYKHLEGKMGTMAGAPDQYQLEDAVFDGFDSGVLESVVPMAQEMGISNDGLNQLLGAALQGQSKVQEASWSAEKMKLGSNADTQIQNAMERLNANFTPEESETIQGMIQTADDFRAMNALLDRALSSSSPAQSADMGAGGLESGGMDIDSMLYAKDADGNLKMEYDLDYAKKVMRMMG